MQMATGRALSLEITRVFKAPIARVFQAWTEPALMAKWFGCDEMTDIKVTQDFRVGGSFRIDAYTGNGGIAVEGVYQEIVTNQRLSYTWSNNFIEFPAKDTLVVVEFKDLGDSTEISLKHTNFSDLKIAEGHEVGWSEALERLSAQFAN